jgi:hypothetical protein
LLKNAKNKKQKIGLRTEKSDACEKSDGKKRRKRERKGDYRKKLSVNREKEMQNKGAW